MDNLIKSILISLCILLVIFLIPIYTLYDIFKSPSFDVGTSSYEYNQAATRILSSDIDDDLKTDLSTMLNISSQGVKQRTIKFLNISSYYVIIISMSLLVTGIYLLKKNIKIIGFSFVCCSIISPVILILTGCITYISYLNY